MKPIDVAYDLDVEERDLLRDREKLGPNARRILKALAERLVVGISHGDFDKPHDWDKESSEEALDLAVYQAAKLLGLGEDCDASSFGCGGYEFIHGKRYTRFHEGPSYNPRVTLVDEDGRTADRKPWLPPKGALVRVVAVNPKSVSQADFKVGEVFKARGAKAWDRDYADIIVAGECVSRTRRVVPA